MALARPGDVVVSFAQLGVARETALTAIGDAEAGLVRILMTNNALAERGGSESYLETVSAELRRLAHEVVLYSPSARRDGRRPAS